MLFSDVSSWMGCHIGAPEFQEDAVSYTSLRKAFDKALSLKKNLFLSLISLKWIIYVSLI